VRVAETANASFLALHPNSQFLYAVSEVPNGEVHAYATEPVRGGLKLIDRASSQGAGPCHIALDATGAVAMTSNYAGGSVVALRIGDDGRFEGTAGFFQHTGSSMHPTRQTCPHPHGAFFAPGNRFVVVPDLGTDRLFIYELGAQNGSVTASHSFCNTRPGAGPRHFVFHPSGNYGYVVNEIDSTVTAFSYDPACGTLSPRITVSTLVPEFEGSNIAGEIEIDPDGKFLYESNRGADTIAVFAVDSEGGLQMVESVPAGGRTPRHIAIDPSGEYLLAANQESNCVVVFRRDREVGRLTPADSTIEVAAPACLVFASPA